MIVAIVVSIFSAQGVVGQDELAILNDDEVAFKEYEYEHQEYAEIDSHELSFQLQQMIARDFSKLHITRTYMSKDNTYKIILQDNNNNTIVVFASANGKLIKPNDNKS